MQALKSDVIIMKRLPIYLYPEARLYFYMFPLVFPHLPDARLVIILNIYIVSGGDLNM